MDNPLSGVPRWAWLAAGGVSVGIIGFRAINNKNKQVDTSAPSDATAPGDYAQTGQSFASGYVDTPYSSAPAYTNDQPDYVGLIGAIGSLQPPRENLSDILGALGPLLGGGAPQSSATQQSPAPPDYAPVPPAPVPNVAPAPKPTVDRCTGAFPFDAGNGDCYRVQCNPPGHAKGRYHFHKSGPCAGGCRVAATC